MASRKKNIIKRKGVPLNIVTFSSAKRNKIQHVTCSIRNEAPNEAPNVHNVPDHRPDEFKAFDNYDEPFMDDYETTASKRKLKAAERWEAIEDLAVDVVVCGMGCPNRDCQACGTTSGVIRCYSCGPSSVYCENCAIEIHKHKMFHHFMEIWKVNCAHTSYVCIILRPLSL